MNFNSGILANIFAMVKGTVFVQILFIAITPLLTRIYTPDELGMFAVYMSTITLFGLIVTLKYELAIPLPRNDQRAFQLLLVSLFSSIALTALLFAVYFFFISDSISQYSEHELTTYQYITAAGIILFALNETLSYWFLRNKHFVAIANSKIIGAIVLAFCQLSAVLVTNSLSFLMHSYVIATLFSSGYLISKMSIDYKPISRLNYKYLMLLMLSFRRFPLYTTMATGVFSVSQAAPIFIITYYFGPAESAYFFMARRLGLLPISLVGRAIGQVNHAELVGTSNNANALNSLGKQIKNLQFMAIVPAAIIAWHAPEICAFVLGSEWMVVGHYLRYMTPFVLIKLIFSPMNAVNYIFGWQKAAMNYDLIVATSSICALIYFCQLAKLETAVAAYFIIQFLVTAIYRLYILDLMKIKLLNTLYPAIFLCILLFMAMQIIN